MRSRGEFFLFFIQFIAVSSCQLRQDEKESWENSVFIGVPIKRALFYWESAGIINIGRHAWIYVCITDHTCRNLASASWFGVKGQAHDTTASVTLYEIDLK